MCEKRKRLDRERCENFKKETEESCAIPIPSFSQRSVESIKVEISHNRWGESSFVLHDINLFGLMIPT